MKKTLLILASVVAITATLSARWGHPGGGMGHGMGHGMGQGSGYYMQQNSNLPLANLTQKQIDDLKYMYQEEKLARDVYITLGNRWNLRVFNNIQRAEQRHMDGVKYLLQRYKLRVPALNSKVGVFENSKLQSLYNQLVSKGSRSQKDALEVGVIVEKTDIADLEEKMQNAPQDIKNVFSRLLRGSYNHLRAFNRFLGN